jgi:RecA/RadA recombinase
MKTDLIEKRDKKIKESKNKKEKKKVVFFSTGSTLLDKVVSGYADKYGFEGGKLHRLSGPSSSGKTFVANETIAAAHRKYKNKLKWNYDDREFGNTIDGNSAYGIDLIDKDTVISNTVQELFININNFLLSIKDDEYGIYVVDSLDALNSNEANARAENILKKGADHKEGSYNSEKQKFLKSTLLPKICEILEKKPNCLLLVVSQLITNLKGGLFSPDTVITGGKGMEYYAHSSTSFTQRERIIKTKEKQEIEIGSRVKCKSIKLKAPRSNRICYISILKEYGIDDIKENLYYLNGFLTVEGLVQKKKQYKYDEVEYELDDLVKKIEDENLESEIIKLVNEKWERIELATRPNRKKRI